MGSPGLREAPGVGVETFLLSFLRTHPAAAFVGGSAGLRTLCQTRVSSGPCSRQLPVVGRGGELQLCLIQPVTDVDTVQTGCFGHRGARRALRSRTRSEGTEGGGTVDSREVLGQDPLTDHGGTLGAATGFLEERYPGWAWRTAAQGDPGERQDPVRAQQSQGWCLNPHILWPLKTGRALRNLALEGASALTSGHSSSPLTGGSESCTTFPCFRHKKTIPMFVPESTSKLQKFTR